MQIRPSTDRPRQVFTLEQEPPNLRGLLFQQSTDGQVEVLAYSGETEPDSEPDIPEAAVGEQGVYISVDGIGQDWNRHREQIRDWFHGGADYGVKLPTPIIGIHEGEGKNGLSDGLRILRNTALLKGLQSGLVGVKKTRAAAYRNDPSVKAIFDQLKQSLRVGRQVNFMAHSGGAAQVALALALLAEEGESWRNSVAHNVRVLGTAPAASRQDFLWAGVKNEDIHITGSERDPVYRFFKNHIDLTKPTSLLRFVGDGLAATWDFLRSPGPYHSGEYIFAGNQVAERHLIADFLNGGAGGSRPLE